MAIDKDQLNRDIENLKKDLLERSKAEQDSKHEQSVLSTLRSKKEIRAGRNEVENKKHREAVNKMTEGAKDLKRSAGYDSFLSGMLAIVAQCKLILDVNPLGSLIKGVAGVGTGAVEWALNKITPNSLDADGHEHEPDWDVSLGSIKDSILTRLGAKKPDEPTLPDLLHYVEFTDTDTLNIASIGKNMRRSDGKDFTPALEQEFARTMELGMTLWLDHNGYEPDQNKPNGFVLKTDHAVTLTNDKFEELRDDPDYGLDTFLSGQYDMNIEKASGPRLTT